MSQLQMFLIVLFIVPLLMALIGIVGKILIKDDIDLE